MSKSKENSTHYLCPGKDHFLSEQKKSRDLSPEMFKKLVTRRIREVNPDEEYAMPETEDERRSFEAILEKISGESNFLPVSFLSEGAKRAKSVCRIKVPTPRGTSLGTGFLITRNLIMTNNHVIENKEQADNASAEFLFEEGQTPTVVNINPTRFFMTDKELDYTIVAVEGTGLEDMAPIRLTRNPALVTRHERVNIVQHPRGRQKEVALQDNKVDRVQDKVVLYNTDTEPGSSGSPVFNNQWELVALHHAGFVNPDGTATNEGIRISAIVDHILHGRRARSESNREVHHELFSSLGDEDPFLGFFGAAGLDKDDLEIQVDGFTGTPTFADVGCWNIENFNNTEPDERVRAVADVFEQLSMDVMGLSEVEEGAMERLKTELNSRGSRYDFEMLNVSGRQDLAVLYDTDTTAVVPRGDIAKRNRKALTARTSNGQSAFPRAPMFAQCQVSHDGDDIEFIMVLVHLKAFGDVQSRNRRRLAAEKLAEVIEDIRDKEDLPVVLCGDFNERLDNDVLSAVTSSPDLFPLTADDASTNAASFVGGRTRSLIDHIIVSRDIKLGEIAGDDAAIVRLDKSTNDFADDVSDHVPIVFRIILREEPVDVGPGTRNTHSNGRHTNGNGQMSIPIPEGASQLLFVIKN